jgi:hypothetical protein
MNTRTNGDAIGFSGTTTARNSLLTNADWNTKEFLYLDTDLHCLMCYKPTVLQFVQYDGQIIGTNPPTITPSNGQVWVGTQRVYTYDDTNKFWKIELYDYNRKYVFTGDMYFEEELNGANIEFCRNGSNYSVIVRQRVNSDKIHYTVNDVQASALLDTSQTVVLLPNMYDGVIYDISITLKFNGVQHQYQLVKYDNTIFIISNTIIVAPSSAYMTMSTFERYLFKKNQYTSKKIIYDVDIETFIIWDGLAFFRFGGQREKNVFPTNPTNGQTFTGSSGIVYTYVLDIDLWTCDFIATKDVAGLLSASDKDKIDKIVATPKNNLTATAIPTTTDDIDKGYSAGSTWVYNNVTYTCTDATKGSAKWVSSADIYYVDTWTALVSLISVAGTTYVGKYITVANANGSPSSGETYISSSGAVTNPISDGGEATLYIAVQGNPYSVTCQKRTITNPVIANVYNTVIPKPTTGGYYIFTVNPSDGLPSNCNLNDICFFDGSTWSKFQSYSVAPAVIVVGASIYSQTSWRKFQGTWMNTADEYIPDGKEYQTGKTWNGKPVFRKCLSGTTPASDTQKTLQLTIPTTGMVVQIYMNVNYSYGIRWITVNFSPSGYIYATPSTGEIIVGTTGSLISNCPFIACVEYTKS